MCAQNALPLCTRHSAQVARGRCSSGRFVAELRHFLVRAAQRQVQEAERIEDGLRRVPEGLDQRLDGRLGGACAPSAWPPMPSMTTSSAECSETATETRSWLSVRFPSRLTSAYSMRKAGWGL